MKSGWNNIIRLSAAWMTGLLLYGQESSRWVDMLSYTQVKEIRVMDDNRWGAATDNAFFIYDAASGEFDKFSTVRGISGLPVTAYYYHRPTGTHFVAHTDGSMELVEEGKIFREQSLAVALIPEERKRVISVTGEGNRLFLGMTFGISEYILDERRFGDTYYIGPGGMETQVNDVAVLYGILYAATQDDGIKYIALDDPYKTDPLRWGRTGTGPWQFLRPFEGRMLGLRGRWLYDVTGGIYRHIYTAPEYPLDFDAGEDFLVFAYPDRVEVLDRNFRVREVIRSTASLPFRIRCVTAAPRGVLIGTEQRGTVVYSFSDASLQSVYPDSPAMNIPFAADVYDGYIWVVYGDYDAMYNPYPFDERDISVYRDGRWRRIPYSAFGARSLTDVKINPQDTSVVYVGSYTDGLLEFRGGQPAARYDGTNAPFPPIRTNRGVEYSYRISPLEFDADGFLWMYQALVMRGLHRFDGRGNWQSYSFESVVDTANNEGAAQMAVDASGNVWLATLRWGVVGLDPASGQMVRLTRRNNIPYEIEEYPDIQAVAVDKDNILWIGTMKGLRILRRPERAFTDPDIRAEPIIIELRELEGQDNQGTELLADTEISEIVVDGANNKWIGTHNAGVFYFSEDGQQTIYHFTSENSPLPGNAIRDIAVDPVTGLVLFSTDRGLIGFKGDASEGRNDLSRAYVYPNPAVMTRHDYIVIRNLMSDISVKITDIAGNLVYETRSRGGSVRWNMENFDGQKVASGVYLILLTDSEGRNTRVLKALIIK
ncbi:MAG: T9SS type A sorting domain-containing protein [Chlorobi bacterium]|nr:T9SS type A sorting domain-containing protein [Chlorobiota bacterium]